MKLSTRLIHQGEEKIEGALNTPIFQTSTYQEEEGLEYSQIKYLRMSNSPTHRALHSKLATLESAEMALAFSSGMAAIATTLLALVKNGESLLAQRTLYGGTHVLFTEIAPRFGIHVEFFDPQKSDWSIPANCKAIYVESLSNPLIEPLDVERVVKFARSHQLLSIVDNTVATPINFQPLSHGFDISVHSATKALNGHSDLIAGAVMGRKALVTKIHKIQSYLGGCLDVQSCTMLSRGLKTLPVRLRAQNISTRKIVEMLREHDHVSRVHYPSQSTAHYSGFGGLLSFELSEKVDPETFIRRLGIAINAPSLGGVETLVTRPSKSSHSAMNNAERHKRGITDRLIRMSVGLEETEDLLSDLRQALS